MTSDEKDDPNLPDYMQQRFNQFKTAKGWDFAGGIMHRPPPLTGLAALHYVEGVPKKKEPGIVISRDDVEILEELVITSFYEAGMVADEIWVLMTVYDVDEICEGDTLFIVEDDSFLVVTGREKSVVTMLPLDNRWVKFGSGYLRGGEYDLDSKSINWIISTSFPSKKLPTVVFPERLICEGKVYKIS